MIFQPSTLIPTEGCFRLAKNVQAFAHPCLNKDIFREFWHNFSFRSSTLTVSERNEYTFSIGNAPILALDGNAYSVNVTPDGICIFAENEQDLIHGLITLLDHFTAVDDKDATAIDIPCCQIKDRAGIQNRMVHFCIFPETELWALQRFVRFCGALKYTHIILEFWGMLQYKCLKELSWSHGFTKEQIRPIIAEANDLGMEVIPMFNHWGHASACRSLNGKHVVLDQNPSLQSYFSEDGWCWDIRKPKTRALLRQIRAELIELCGSGSYFHIGCDEASHFNFTEENTAAVCDFINEVSDELNAQNRRAIAWGDMFLYRHSHYNPQNKYACNAPSPEIEQFFLKHLCKKIILADWQYSSPVAPVETVLLFKEAGFDCLLCSWDKGRPHIEATIDTVKKQSLMGFMHTTWHTLSAGMPCVTLMATGGWDTTEEYHVTTGMRMQTAALIRKVLPANGNYEKAGWSKYQIGFRW